MSSQLIKMEMTEGRIPSTPSEYSGSSHSADESVDQLADSDGDISDGAESENRMELSDAPALRAEGKESQGRIQSEDADAALADSPPSSPLRCQYQSVSEIIYTPESAIHEGIAMVKALAASLRTLVVENKARKDIWRKEVEALTSQDPPATLIAVCGATGVGKSSILNAILRTNIIPTSCSQACTSVVTEISYHDEATIIGEVDFLTEDEWKGEISVLLSDLVGEHGVATRRPVDTKSPSGIAWHKIQAVYPQVKFEELVHMTVDGVMALDKRVTRILGTTKELASDSAEGFSQMIREYIDSSYQSPEQKSSSSKVRIRPPAFWPLIRQVHVLCNAEALSTGAVLVDLPGIGDANAARNLIAKDYMKKANCVWILAPIVRAVDDKIARDLLGEAFKLQLMINVETSDKVAECISGYDDHSVTFIATKCDDIACAEVIRALNLRHNPRFQAIEDRITELNATLEDLQGTQCSCKILTIACNHEVERLESEIALLDSQIEALQSADTKSTHATPDRDQFLPREGSSKRKLGAAETEQPSKRQKQSDNHVTNPDGMVMNFERSSEVEVATAAPSDREASPPSIDGDALEQRRMEYERAHQKALAKAWNMSKKSRTLEVQQQDVETELGLARKERYAFCSLERSEHSRGIIVEDFRAGLRELEATTPDGENESKDYSSVNLPVFTCSSRDFLRLTNQTDDDKGTACFCNVEDTGIPALQKWCHRLTIASRERTARSFITRLLAFANSIQTYARGVGNVTAEDRAALRSKWESAGGNNTGLSHCELRYSYTLDKKFSAGSGIAVRLSQEFSGLVDVCVRDLKTQLRAGLLQKCKNGAAKAAKKAVETVDKIASGMAWNTYRATLARDGVFHIDLNTDLAEPFTKAIARSWNSQFRNLSFRPLEDEILNHIAALLQEVQESATIGVQDRAKILSDGCLEEARVVVKHCIHKVKSRVLDHQKGISRTMASHIRKQLREGYRRAMAECGTGGGSAQRRKALFREFVDQNKDMIFRQGFDVVMRNVEQAVKSVANALDDSLEGLAQKVEVNFSTIWEVYQDDPTQIRARKHVADVATHACEQLRMWLDAARLKNEKDKVEYDASCMAH
ncbi:hypothetical protein FA13DRAFT_1777191 [Coprinellus micaceus]|uniref:G domain-containing protein n=1 Tax=Coprinellus micaceus TaxID=71717 RepID=A0A4Y7SVR4_COPMI|nr:hypothetical protein FA13DRAFT_1777191 [Coprinellus micaceus]